MEYPNCGFNIGDKFTYFSKYSKKAAAFGIVQEISEVQSFERGVWVKRYVINGMYDSKEILPYENVEN